MSLIDQLMKQLGDDGIGRIASEIGADRGATSTAVSGALPVLLGALAKNASSDSGAKALSGALERDHDGSVLDDLGALIGSRGAKDGDGILGHMLGARRGRAEAGLAAASGLDAGSVGQILRILAPMVMAGIGKEKRSRALDPTDLGSLLQGERRKVSGGAADLMTSLLDQDGDGSVLDDVAGLAGKLFGRR